MGWCIQPLAKPRNHNLAAANSSCRHRRRRRPTLRSSLAQGEARPVLGTGISDSAPFSDIAGDKYEASGREELRRHQAELAARQPHVSGIPLHAAAAAIWRKKVAWGWEPRLQELIGTLGIG